MSKTEWTQFEQALLEANLEEFADVPAEDSIDLTLSEEFELEGLELVEKARRGKVPRFGKTLRRALLIAAIIAALATAAMAIPAVREGIIRFFTHDVGTHHVIEFDPEQAATAPKYIEKVFVPTFVPAEFRLKEGSVNFARVIYLWEHNTNPDWYVFYEQQPLPLYPNGGPDSEHTTSRYIIWDNYKVFCVEDDIWRYYGWTDNSYYYELICYADISEDEIYRIFESITEDPEAEIPYQ